MIQSVHNGQVLNPYLKMAESAGKVDEKKDGLFDLITDIADDVSRNEKSAESQMKAVMLGESDDTHGALIAMQKAEMQFSLVSTAKDRIVAAYEKMMNMSN